MTTTRAWLQIHFCVVLWGCTAVLGKLISLKALPLVWWRMVLVAAALLFVRRFWSGLAGMTPRQTAIFAGTGVFVAAHWLTFYGAIKLANASVAATCMALIPVFMSFTEPLVTRRRFELAELLFGLACVPGVMLVVGGTPSQMHLGVAVGAASAFFAAVFGSLNKRYIASHDVLAVTGVEMTAGALLLTLAAPLAPDDLPVFVLPSGRDALLLLFLAFGCTLLPFALSLATMRRLSAFSIALAINMEPVYAITLATLLLGEQHELSPSFYAGVAILLLIVFSHPWISQRTARARLTAANVDSAVD